VAPVGGAAEVSGVGDDDGVLELAKRERVGIHG
jgi:hypothetical protein